MPHLKYHKEACTHCGKWFIYRSLEWKAQYERPAGWDICRKIKNVNVTKQKYLGFIISEDGSNLKNTVTHEKVQ